MTAETISQRAFGGHRPPLQKKLMHREVAACAQIPIVQIVKQFLEFVIRQLVEFPDEMMLSEIPSGKTTIFRVQLRQTDVGRIIGRNGQTIQAIRALLASSAARHGQRATLEIVE
jgi:predicted RNA-binding protein YlqC (UPF0109 family)